MTNGGVKSTSSKPGAWEWKVIWISPIYLSSAGPVSIDLVTDLQRIVYDQIEQTIKLGVFVFQEAKVHGVILTE